jgi:hypothetical protein
MIAELAMSTHLNGDPKAHAQNKCEKGTINFYGELFRSACSLSEILDALGPYQSKSENGGITSVRKPQTACESLAANINSEIAAASRNSPIPEHNLPTPADIHALTGTEIVARFWNFERFWSGEFQRLIKDVVFGTFCAAAIVSASIAAFSIARGNHNSDPAPYRVQSDTLSRNTVVASAPVDAPPESPSSGAQPLSVGLAVAAITAPPSDKGQPQVAEPQDTAPKPEDTATAKVPIENISKALPSRVHAANRRTTRASRRYVELRRHVRRQTPSRYSQPEYYGQPSGPRGVDFDRGYSYGGPAPYSETGG